MRAVKNGSVLVNPTRSTRRRPWTRMRTLESGYFSILRIRPAVPRTNRPSGAGSSSSGCFCATIASMRSPASACSTTFNDGPREMSSGTIADGKTTTPRSGSTGSSAGTLMPLRSSSKPKARSFALVGCSSGSLMTCVRSVGAVGAHVHVVGLLAHRHTHAEQPGAELGGDAIRVGTDGQGHVAFERAVVDLQLLRLGTRPSADGRAVAADAQAAVLGHHLQVGLVHAGELDDDGDAVREPIDVDVRPPGLLQAIAPRRGELE